MGFSHFEESYYQNKSARDYKDCYIGKKVYILSSMHYTGILLQRAWKVFTNTPSAGRLDHRLCRSEELA